MRRIGGGRLGWCRTMINNRACARRLKRVVAGFPRGRVSDRHPAGEQIAHHADLGDLLLDDLAAQQRQGREAILRRSVGLLPWYLT